MNLKTGKMNYFQLQQKLLKSLREKVVDSELADELIFKIDLVGDRYSLIMKEVGEMYDIIDKIINGQTQRSELLENLLERLEVTKKEIGEVASALEKEILNSLEKKGVIAKRAAEQETAEINEKLELVKQVLSKKT